MYYIADNCEEMQNKVLLIADDHVIIRRGLKMLINVNFTSCRIYEASTNTELLQQLSEKMVTHLILDLQLADGNAMANLAEIKRLYPLMPIMVYTMNSEELFASRIYNMGAQLFLSKQAEETEVIKQLQFFFTNTWDKQISSPPETTDSLLVKHLSERELLVAIGLAAGKSIKEISFDFQLKPSTIATYKVRLFEKLEVKNMMEFKTVFDAYQQKRED